MWVPCLVPDLVCMVPHLQFWRHDRPVLPGPGRESPLCQTQLLQSQQWRGGEYYTATHGGLFGLGCARFHQGLLAILGFIYIYMLVVPGEHELLSVQVVLLYWIGARGAIQSYAIALHPVLRNLVMRPVHTQYMYVWHGLTLLSFKTSCCAVTFCVCCMTYSPQSITMREVRQKNRQVKCVWWVASWIYMSFKDRCTCTGLLPFW